MRRCIRLGPLGCFISKCEADGSFSNPQCNPSTGRCHARLMLRSVTSILTLPRCWCVDNNGVIIDGTDRAPWLDGGYPNCSFTTDGEILSYRTFFVWQDNNGVVLCTSTSSTDHASKAMSHWQSVQSVWNGVSTYLFSTQSSSMYQRVCARLPLSFWSPGCR